jgi:hypothetical protein
MQPIIIFCKSYNKEIYRARRMAESVNRFNIDNIPLYISVPTSDLDNFKNCFKNIPCNFITDEEILSKTCQVFGKIPMLFPEHLIQQLIKLEFWRMGLCQNYFWIDSDSYFIKHFSSLDFLSNDNIPYTVQHDFDELRDLAKRIKKNKIIADFETMAIKFQKLFDRSGPYYDFGPSPLVWSCRVLNSLYEDYLKPKNLSIFSLLQDYPCEMQLYGEYLHYSKLIPIIPVQPIFKVFHYPEQFFESQMKGESEDSISKNYLGIVYQSNWSKIKERKKIKERIKGHLKDYLRTIIYRT